tara:strand:+ start:2864 stop:3658 length:795 start_codon:yes stop_codon:yes gene_type:complete
MNESKAVKGTKGNFAVLHFIKYKLKANLKAEASRNYLGYLWWLLEPAMLLGVFYFVFGVLLNYGRDGFESYLLVGITFWLVFANTVTHSCNSIQTASGIIQQVYVPKWVFPVIAVLSNYVKFLFVLLTLFGFAIYSGFLPDVSWLGLLYFIPIYLIFVMGCALVAAAITPIFPDIKFIIQAGIQMLMFGSGIFYQYDMIPEKYLDLFLLNPVARAIYYFREIILFQKSPDFFDLLYILIFGVILIGIGLAILLKLDRRYPRLVI